MLKLIKQVGQFPAGTEVTPMYSVKMSTQYEGKVNTYRVVGTEINIRTHNTNIEELND